jgi:hypothetical protein
MVKAKFTPEEVTKAYRGSKCIDLEFFSFGARLWWVVNATPRPFYPGNETRYPLYRRLGRPQGPSERVWNISPPLRFDPRTVQTVVSPYTDCALSAHRM